MKITKHSQSCFLIEAADNKILIDPGSYVFDLEKLKPTDFTDVNIIIFTHIDSDHFDFGRMEEILKYCSPVIVADSDVKKVIDTGIRQLDVKTMGHKIKYVFGSVTVEGFKSEHGCYRDNTKSKPSVTGVVVSDFNKRFYHPGDSVVLDKNSKADVIAVPISSPVTMNIEEAKKQLVELMPKLVVPMHYDSPKYPVDVNDFAKAMEGTGIVAKVLKNGETIEV